MTKPLIQIPESRDARKGHIYIAGPMTDLPGMNFPAFNAAAELLKQRGWSVTHNPAEHGVVEGANWQDYMLYDLGEVAKCEAIYLLPGWTTSKGALLELLNARMLGLAVHYDYNAEVPPAEGDWGALFRLMAAKLGAKLTPMRYFIFGEDGAVQSTNNVKVADEFSRTGYDRVVDVVTNNEMRGDESVLVPELKE